MVTQIYPTGKFLTLVKSMTSNLKIFFSTEEFIFFRFERRTVNYKNKSGEKRNRFDIIPLKKLLNLITWEY